MKADIHPKYYPNAKVICSTCGNTWTVGSTVEVIHTDLCNNCHPFYTGEQRIVDTEGQVERFLKKLSVRDELLAAEASRRADRTSPDLPIAELGLGTRPQAALTRAGFQTVSEVLDKLSLGEQTLLEVDGFGRKSLIDLKKNLRARGFALPEDAVQTSEDTAA